MIPVRVVYHFRTLPIVPLSPTCPSKSKVNTLRPRRASKSRRRQTKNLYNTISLLPFPKLIRSLITIQQEKWDPSIRYITWRIRYPSNCIRLCRGSSWKPKLSRAGKLLSLALSPLLPWCCLASATTPYMYNTRAFLSKAQTLVNRLFPSTGFSRSWATVRVLVAR